MVKLKKEVKILRTILNILPKMLIILVQRANLCNQFWML